MTIQEQHVAEVEKISNNVIQSSGPMRRILLVPFEMGLCLFSIYSGISGLLNFGSSNLLFVEAIHGANVFNMIFILAGASTILGVAFLRANIEALGLCCIISSLLIRLMAILASAGWNQTSHNLIAVSAIFVLACVIRLGMIYAAVKDSRFFIQK